MSTPSKHSDFLMAVAERGFFHQCTEPNNLDRLATLGPITGYIGYDCTAPSLHVGSLMSIMLLRIFQKTGHKPIVLMGGATSKVGDPSGKDEARKLLSDEEIARNKASIRKVFNKFLKFGNGPMDAIMVDNSDWLEGINHIQFLRDIGGLISVNRMLAFDSVKLRLDREQMLSYLEFSYQVLQAFDFVELARGYDCVLQMGGSDQWGNIVLGVDLARRLLKRNLFGLTTTLLTTSSGAKMGKTAAGAIWLDAEMLSPYDYWQYWRNVHDADVGRFLRLFTELPLEEVVRLERLRGEELNEAKRVLATETTRLLHGEDAAAEAAETARRVFDEGSMATALSTIDISLTELEAGIAAFDMLRRTGLAASNSEARRLIQGGGGRLNDRPIESETRPVTAADLNQDGLLKMSAGRKRHVLVKAK